MQRFTEAIGRALRWLPAQYHARRQSSQGQVVPVLHILQNLNGNQTKQLKEQLDKIKRFGKVSAIALLVDNSEGSAAQAHIIIQRLKIESKKLNVPFLTFGQDACTGSGFLLLAAGDKVQEIITAGIRG